MSMVFSFFTGTYRTVVAIVMLIPMLLTMWIPDMPGTEIISNENATNPHINEYLDTMFRLTAQEPVLFPKIQ